MGSNAGKSDQVDNSIAIGLNAGTTSQSGATVAIGRWAGHAYQGGNSIAIGNQSAQCGQNPDGTYNSGWGQGERCVALGCYSGLKKQGDFSIAIGNGAGGDTQGEYCIAIGSSAGAVNQPNNSIVIGNNINTSAANEIKLGGPDNNTVISGTLHVNKTILCDDSVTAGSFIAASDRNLKQNIVPIERALDKVCCLEGVHYEFKNAPDVKRMGLIAQDVEKIIPEVVSENNEGTKGIDYGPIVSILIESVKELNQSIKGLTEENLKLNKKIEDMQK
jgi:hypothetical protein